MISRRPILATPALSLALLLAASTASLACGPAAPSPQTADAAPDQADAPAVEATPAVDAKPRISSPDATFEFGELRPSQSVSHVFTIENKGDADLHIERVQRT